MTIHLTIGAGNSKEIKDVSSEEIWMHLKKTNFDKLDDRTKIKAMANIVLEVINSKGKIRSWENFHLGNIRLFFKISRIPPPENAKEIFDSLVKSKTFIPNGDSFVFNRFEHEKLKNELYNKKVKTKRAKFTKAERKLIWSQPNSHSHICHICKQEILTIEEMEIDHVRAYSKGGKKMKLAHKLCNRIKGSKSLGCVRRKLCLGLDSSKNI